jgi:hypothetical protein
MDDKYKGRKFIALDVDGVLNTDWSRDTYGLESMLPSRVSNLVRICSRTGCLIVISSCWRLGGIGVGSPFHTTLAKYCGDNLNYLMERVVDKTLDLPGSREDEVLEFMNEFGIENFAAIDDDADHYPSKPSWLILTDPWNGLDDEIADKLIHKLGGI